MYMSMMLSGFGGQGVLTTGKLISSAAIEANLQTTWLPSYGPEMRGGTANCTVIVSDSLIGAPVAQKIDVLVAMNNPSVTKFENDVKTNGYMFINSSIVSVEATRNDVEILRIPFNKLAEEIGNVRVANIILYGAIIQKTKVIPLDIARETIKHKLGRKKEFLEMNLKAFDRGVQYIKELQMKEC